MRKCGIAYQPRGSGRRSFHSTQMIGGMPETRGRGTGGTERQKGKGREMRKTEPNWFSRIQGYHWRAVCGESCKHGFGKGRQEKVRKEPRLPPTSQHLGKGIRRYPGAQGNPRARLVKRLGRDDLYCPIRDGRRASHLAEPRTPRILCGGVSGSEGG